MSDTDYVKVHEDAIVIDAVCPLLTEKKYLDWYMEGGATAVAPTVGGWKPASEAIKAIGSWIRFIEENEHLILVRRAKDIESAKKTSKIGIMLHFQGTDPLEGELDLIPVYKALGVGMIQLTYNTKNRVGDGAQERTDCGLSHFGIDFVKRCNESNVIIDCSHTGYRTTMEAIERSEHEVVFSHANAKAVKNSSRNITDEQIKAVAETGGLVGAAGFPSFVSDSDRPTLDQFIAHIDHVVEVAGIDHVGLGIDYYTGQHLVADPENAEASYRRNIKDGRWRADAYPPPPHRYPEGIETPSRLPRLTGRLFERGYSEQDVRKILGLNWLRVFKAVWG